MCDGKDHACCCFCPSKTSGPGLGAGGITYRCVIEHEQEHIDEIDNANGCKDKKAGETPPGHTPDSECRAYDRHATCLAGSVGQCDGYGKDLCLNDLETYVTGFYDSCMKQCQDPGKCAEYRDRVLDAIKGAR